MCLSKMCFPPRAGSRFYKKWQNFQRKGFIKHEKQKENSRSHTTFTKLQLLCRQLFLQTGLGSENCTGVEPQAVFEGGTERAHSEAIEQQSDKSKQNLQKLIILKPLGGQKSKICDRRCSKSFFRNVLPTLGREHIFANNSKNNRCNAKMQNAWRRFSKMCFPPRAGSTFLQRIPKINDVMQRCKTFKGVFQKCASHRGHGAHFCKQFQK